MFADAAPRPGILEVGESWWVREDGTASTRGKTENDFAVRVLVLVVLSDVSVQKIGSDSFFCYCQYGDVRP